MLTSAPWLGRAEPIPAASAGASAGLNLREQLENSALAQQKLLLGSVVDAAKMQQQGTQFNAELSQRKAIADAQAELERARNNSIDAWRQGELKRYADAAKVKADQAQAVADLLGELHKAQTNPAAASDTSDPAGELSANLPALAAPASDPGSELMAPATNPDDMAGELSAAAPTTLPVTPTTPRGASATLPVDASTPPSVSQFLTQHPGATSDPTIRAMVTQEAIGKRSADAQKIKDAQKALVLQDTSALFDELSRATNQAQVFQAKARHPNADMTVLRSEKITTPPNTTEPVLKTVQLPDGKNMNIIYNPKGGGFKVLDDKETVKAREIQFKITGLNGQLAPLLKRKLEAEQNPKNAKLQLTTTEQNRLERLESDRSGLMAQMKAFTNTTAAKPAAAPAATSTYKTPDEVKADVQSRKLSKDDGVKILKDQFKDQFE